MPQTSGALPVLTVTLDGSVEQMAPLAGTELKTLRSEFGQIVSVPHEFRLISDGWTLIIPQTRFSSIDFTAGRIRGVEVSPQLDYVTLQEAATRVGELENTFDRFGFTRDQQRSLTPTELLRRESVILNDPSYNSEVYRGRRATVESSIVLKKSVLKDSPIGRLAQANSDLFALTLTVRTVRTQ